MDTDSEITAWFKKNVDPLYAFVFHRVGSNTQTAADVTQMTMSEALQTMEKFDPERGTMQAWLRVLSRNHIRKAMRYTQRNIAMLDVWEGIDTRLELLYQQMAAEPWPDEVLERSETRELVSATLASMPSHYRRIA